MRKRCKEDDEDEDNFVDFEDSGDDYQPTESSESEDDIKMNSSSSSEDESKVIKIEARPVQKALQSRKTRFATRQQQELVFESDKYFGHTNRKVGTDRLSHYRQNF